MDQTLKHIQQNIEKLSKEIKDLEYEREHIEDLARKEVKYFLTDELIYMHNNGNGIRPSKNNKKFIQYFMIYQGIKKYDDVPFDLDSIDTEQAKGIKTYDWDDVLFDLDSIDTEQAKSIFAQEEKKYLKACFEEMLITDIEHMDEISVILQHCIQKKYQPIFQWLKQSSADHEFLQLAYQVHQYYCEVSLYKSDVIIPHRSEPMNGNLLQIISTYDSGMTKKIDIGTFIECLIIYFKSIYPSLGSEGISKSHQESPSIYHMISKTLMEYRDDLKQSVVEKRIWETHKNQCEEYIQSIDSNESFLTSKIKDLEKSRELYKRKYHDNIEKRSDPHTAIERAAERAQIVVQSIQDEHLSYDKGKI